MRVLTIAANMESNHARSMQAMIAVLPPVIVRLEEIVQALPQLFEVQAHMSLSAVIHLELSLKSHAQPEDTGN
eukprot:440908-Amorphochlora_amoeboformis.AAC.3